MTPEEKAIVSVAAIYANKTFNPKIHKENQPNFYCNDLMESVEFGAKSPEAKAYWQKGMYTEEEVYSLIKKYHAVFATYSTMNLDLTDKWFEQNKKK